MNKKNIYFAYKINTYKIIQNWYYIINKVFQLNWFINYCYLITASSVTISGCYRCRTLLKFNLNTWKKFTDPLNKTVLKIKTYKNYFIRKFFFKLLYSGHCLFSLYFIFISRYSSQIFVKNLFWAQISLRISFGWLFLEHNNYFLNT